MHRTPASTTPPRRRRQRAPVHPAPVHSEISAGLPAPKQQRRLSKTVLTPAQRRVARRLVREYQAGPKPGSAVRALDKLGQAYAKSPLTHGWLGGGTLGPHGVAADLLRMADPIALEQTLKRRAEHPLRMDKGINAGIVFPGFGRGALPEGVVERTIQRPRTRTEAEQRLAAIDTAQAKVEAGILGKRKTIDPAEQARRNRINGLIDLYEKQGIRKPGTAQALRAGRQPTVSEQFAGRAVDDFMAEYPEHPVVKAYVARAHEGEQLRQALSAQHFPGESAPKDVPGQFGHVTETKLGPPAEQVVAKSLGTARRLAAEQKRLGREERGARVERGLEAMEQAGGGIAGHKAFMREQRGALPKTTFEKLRQGNLTHADVEELVRQAQEHPDLQPFQKAAVSTALLNAFHHSVTPRPFEIKLLQQVYGQDAAAALARPSLWTRAGRAAGQVAGLPRSLESTADVSFLLRQGLVAATRHPRIFKRQIRPMFRDLLSEKVYQARATALHERPNFPLYEQAGLNVTEMAPEIGKREEAYPSSIAEKIPLAGRVVRASGRAFTGAAAHFRADLFDRALLIGEKQGEIRSLVRPWKKTAIHVEDQRFLRDVAKVINSATGRGSFGRYENAATVGQALFFSPRLIKSRIDFLNPLWYARLHPFARREALTSAGSLAAAAAITLELAHLAGGQVGGDPHSADFGKIRLGKTRIDILGGFQQYVRAGTQIGSGRVVSSTTGRTMTLGGGYGQMNRWDIFQRFAASKANPAASLLYDLAHGQTFTGAPLTPQNTLGQRLVPLGLQDAYDLYRSSRSLPAAVGGYGLSAVGVGVQTYGNPATARASKKLSDARKRQSVHLAALVRKGVLPRDQRARMREALDVYNKRNQFNTTIDAATKNHPVAREQQKMTVLLKLLEKHRVKPPDKTWGYWHHYYATKNLTPKEMQRDREWFWRYSGLGHAISWYREAAGAND